MKQIIELNNQLSQYLEQNKTDITENIKDILTYKNIIFTGDATKSDMVAFCFEYEYDYLDIIFYGIDKEWNPITETVVLPSVRKSKATETSTWSAFMPEKIWREITTFEENYEEDDIDEIISDYNEKKYNLFEEWFCSCWKEANSLIKTEKDAYFSIHDTIFKTDLHTSRTIKEKEILDKYKFY